MFSTNMLLQSIDALGGTTYNYDRRGHQTSMTDALGHVTKMTYDARGRLASTIDANGATNIYAYDNNGNLLSLTDALGRVTRYKYDERNRLISTTGGCYRIRVKTCKIGIKALSRLDFRNHFRLIRRSAERTEAMLKRSNRFVAMVTAIA
jgi:YD repeat-containing protein